MNWPLTVDIINLISFLIFEIRRLAIYFAQTCPVNQVNSASRTKAGLSRHQLSPITFCQMIL